MMRYIIDEWVGEKQPEITNLINKGGNLLLVAPTGSGKTYTAIEYSKQHPNKQIAFLVPTRSLVDNLKDQNKDVPCGYGAEWLSYHKRESFIISTYDSIRLLENIDVLFIDEAHLQAGHCSFRDVIPLLLAYKSQKILISGTPEIIDLMPNYQRVDFKFKYQAPRFVDVIQTTKKSEETILSIINNIDNKALTIIRHNDKKILQRIYDRYIDTYGNKIAMYYSSSNLSEIQGEQVTQDLKKGEIPNKIMLLLCTSIYDAGLSLKVSKHVNCYAVANEHEPMPNAIDMVQLLARVRTSEGTMKLTIIGEYGDMPRMEDNFQLPTHPRQLISLFDTIYDWYSHYNMEAYVGILYYYNIRVNEVQEFDSNINHTIKQSRISPLTLAKNFNNYPKHYNKIDEMLRLKNDAQWLDVITGNYHITGNAPNGIYDMRDNFIDAIKHNIHFSLFVTHKYDCKKLKNLVNAVKTYNKNAQFKAVIDNLIDGLNNQVCKEHKMSLDGYRTLIKSQREMIRKVSNLFYSGKKWDDKKRKTILLEKRDNDELTNQYLQNFIVGVDDTFKLIEQSFNKAS